MFWVLLGLETGVYYFLVGRDLLANPAFSGLTPQIQSPPSPLQAILGWGLLSSLIVMAFFSKEKNKKTLFLKIWFISHFLVIYLPFGFQKLMIRDLWVSAAILAVEGAKEISRQKNWDYRLIAGLLLIFASFSTFFITP